MQTTNGTLCSPVCKHCTECFTLYVHTTALCLYIYTYIPFMWYIYNYIYHSCDPHLHRTSTQSPHLLVWILLWRSSHTLDWWSPSSHCCSWSSPTSAQSETDTFAGYTLHVHYSSRVSLINVASSLINIASCQRSVSVENQLSTKILHTFLIIIIIITYCLCWFCMWSQNNTCQHTCRDE